MPPMSVPRGSTLTLPPLYKMLSAKKKNPFLLFFSACEHRDAATAAICDLLFKAQCRHRLILFLQGKDGYTSNLPLITSDVFFFFPG